jgi:hypothetical protein
MTELYVNRIIECCKNKNGTILCDDLQQLYINNRTIINIKCNICQTIWESSYQKLIGLNNWCTTCAKDKKTSERLFMLVLKEMFPNYNFISNVRPGFLKNPETGSNLEIDMFCDELKLGIEKNGEQHYKIGAYHRPRSTKGLSKDEINKIKIQNFNTLVKTDELKKKLCEENGIELVVIKAVGGNWVDIIKIKKVMFELLSHRPECVIKLGDPWLTISAITNLTDTAKTVDYKRKLLEYIDNNKLGYALVDPNVIITGKLSKFKIKCNNNHIRDYNLSDFLYGKHCYQCRKSCLNKWNSNSLKDHFEYFDFKINFNFIPSISYVGITKLAYQCKECNKEYCTTVQNILIKIKRLPLLCDCDKITQNYVFKELIWYKKCYFTNINIISPDQYKFLKYNSKYIMVSNFIYDIVHLHLNGNADNLIKYLTEYDFNQNVLEFNDTEITHINKLIKK